MRKILLLGFWAVSAVFSAQAGYIELKTLDWSPDGKWWLIVQRGDVYVISPGGEDLQRLTDEGDVIWARFAPDGEHFYYVAEEADRVVKRGSLSGGEPEVVLQEEGVDFSYAVPFRDGRRLLVICNKGGQADLWIYDLETAEFTRLTNTPWPEETPDVSPNGELIAFVGLWGESWDVFVLKVENRDISHLTEDLVFDWGPRFSPDGEWIAFESVRSGNSEIWVMRWNGEKLTFITHDPWRNAFPAWSPDMEKVAFGTRLDGETDWIIATEGTY
jgi:TolB protein